MASVGDGGPRFLSICRRMGVCGRIYPRGNRIRPMPCRHCSGRGYNDTPESPLRSFHISHEDRIREWVWLRSSRSRSESRPCTLSADLLYNIPKDIRNRKKADKGESYICAGCICTCPTEPRIFRSRHPFRRVGGGGRGCGGGCDFFAANPPFSEPRLGTRPVGPLGNIPKDSRSLRTVGNGSICTNCICICQTPPRIYRSDLLVSASLQRRHAPAFPLPRRSSVSLVVERRSEAGDRISKSTDRNPVVCFYNNPKGIRNSREVYVWNNTSPLGRCRRK